MKVKVLRAFYYKAERLAPNTVVDLPAVVAREVIDLGKAEGVAETPPPSGPMTTESVPVIVAGKKRKSEVQ
jgi:hypothetical protein